MKRIVFTGRGSAGHMMVNLALIPKFLELGWEVKYIGSQQGIEADLVQKLDGIDYCGIATGKWRRYWDRENFKQASRGDQILNAHSFRSSGYAEVLMEENMNDETFLNAVDTVFAKREEMIARMNQNSEGPFADRLVEWIQMVSR